MSKAEELNYKCLVCDKRMFISGVKRNFIGGVAFSTKGNHGSFAWDSCGEAYGVICDRCFINKSPNMTAVSYGDYDNPSSSGAEQQLSKIFLKDLEHCLEHIQKNPSSSLVKYFTLFLGSYFQNSVRKEKG